jgi:hypothetical protein
LKGSGLVQITAYSDDDGPTAAVVLTGAIGDFGMAVRTYAHGQVEQQYNRLALTLSRGSFRLEIAGMEGGIVAAMGQFPTDLNTCSGIEVVHARSPIVPGSGTGVYKGIGGTFQLTTTINEVDSWPNCPRAGQNLIAQTVFVTGLGAVSFR